jgi:hypothetical protein
MTRQAERALDGTAVTSSNPAKVGRWSRRRSALLPRMALAALLIAAAFGIGQIGINTVLQVAGAVALLIIAVGAAAVGSLALMLRRRLAELKHLPDLGRPYVTNHEGGRVTNLLRDRSGNVVLEVASDARQTIVMDENGAPEHMTAGGAAIVKLPIPGSAAAEPEVLSRLQSLCTEQVPVRVVSEGLVALAGPVLSTWRLETEDGLVVTSRA